MYGIEIGCWIKLYKAALLLTPCLHWLQFFTQHHTRPRLFFFFSMQYSVHCCPPSWKQHSQTPPFLYSLQIRQKVKPPLKKAVESCKASSCRTVKNCFNFVRIAVLKTTDVLTLTDVNSPYKHTFRIWQSSPLVSELQPTQWLKVNVGTWAGKC